MDLLPFSPNSTSIWSERQIRARIDRAVLQGLADATYARTLLTNPSVVLEGAGCTPQQHRQLTSIRATDIVEFARQAEAQFWPSRTQRSHADVRAGAATG